MQILQLIEDKRSGNPLTVEQIGWLVDGTVAGTIPDYQLSALLMAICYEGLNFDETLSLTRAFVASGAQLSWDGLAGPVVDKHSTGGVGDKVSLLLVPWLAAAGCIVPKMSGRGLGHTGGTIDKLESIPGFRTGLNSAELAVQLKSVGCAIVAQSEDLVPADRLFYALRDATGTVNEQGLIAASIMSKKLSGGAQHIVLDVKCGNGAFFAVEQQAREFAELSVRIGEQFGRRVAYVISPMDAPLGRAVGNALEVEEAVEVAATRAADNPLVDNCLELGSLLLVSAGMGPGAKEARQQMLELLEGGEVERKLNEWIAAQGGRIHEFAELLAREKQARRTAVTAHSGGRVCSISALAVGRLANRLGAGRSRKEDPVDPFAGVELLCEVGSTVAVGDELALLYPGRGCELTGEALQAELRAAIRLEN